MRTSLGDFVVELDHEKSPASVENFLNYAEEGFYAGTIFHAVEKGYVIVGGTRTADLVERRATRVVEKEARNDLGYGRGVVLRGPNDRSAFAIAVGDRYQGIGRPQVFGRVVEGMDVVDRINAIPVSDSHGLYRVPKETVTILEVLPGVRRDGSREPVADSQTVQKPAWPHYPQPVRPPKEPEPYRAPIVRGDVQFPGLAFWSFAALALGGTGVIAGGLGRLLASKEEARQNATIALGVGVAVLTILGGSWLVAGIYNLSTATAAAARSAPLVATGIITAIVAFVAIGLGWNVLNRRLNAVKKARRVIDAITVKAGFAPEALLRVAHEAGAHERELQIGVAKAHSTNPAVIIGGVSIKTHPPGVTATPLFGESQREIRESEAELLSAWRAWTTAAEEYDNARSTFPLALVAWMFRFPDVHDWAPPTVPGTTEAPEGA